MKSIVFDTGPIISLSMNNLLWILEVLKEKYGGRFYITSKVKEELIDRPLQTKKYRLEAVQVLPLISKGVLEVYDSKNLKKNSMELMDIANESYKAKNNWIKILHPAEMEVIAAALELNSDAIVVDET